MIASLSYLFGFFAFVCALLFRAKFTKGQREKHPTLKKLDGKQVHLFVLTVVFSVIALGANIYKDEFNANTALESTWGPHGELIQKATPTVFEKELENAAGERKSEAKDYFNAAERDFKSWRYREAADNYRKSINALPTVSAYLNLGLSLLYISDFREAEKTFASGLTIARKRENKIFEGAFIGNIGLIYVIQGNLNDGLYYSKAALEIYKNISYPKGQANALVTIGIIYHEQGKLDDALEIYSEAFKINEQTEDPEVYVSILLNNGAVYIEQGKLDKALESFHKAIEINEQLKDPEIQANAMLNIGIINDYQGNFDEALNYSWEALKNYNITENKIGQAYALLSIGSSYNNQKNPEDSLKYAQAALKIFNETGYPIGEAKALYVVGVVYVNQGNKSQALKIFDQVRVIYQKLGVTPELRKIENMMNRLNTTVNNSISL